MAKIKVSVTPQALDDLIKEAIEFLRENEPEEGYFMAFSGGKDSIVTLRLTHMAGVRNRAYYSVSGIDPPEVVRYIKHFHPEVQFLHPPMSFYKAIEKKFPPLRSKRWCCDILRKYPSRRIPLKHRIMGIRAEESPRRAKRPRIDYNKREKTWIYKPIFDWKEWALWEFIERFRLPYSVLYEEGWDRVGCVVCPFICSANMAHVRRNKARWPGIYKAFEHAVSRWFEARKAQGGQFKEATAEEYLESWYRGIS